MTLPYPWCEPPTTHPVRFLPAQGRERAVWRCPPTGRVFIVLNVPPPVPPPPASDPCS